MSALVVTLQGRFGNQVMQYLFCRALSEAYGYELRIDQWVGFRVFDISHPRPDGRDVIRCNETNLWEAIKFDLIYSETKRDLEFRGYAQMQQCMTYTKRQAQAWLKLRPEIETACANAVASSFAAIARVVCHQRIGDYKGYGYPLVSLSSYENACRHFGLKFGIEHCVMLLEENPIPHAGHLPDDLSFMPDFYRMMTAPTLLRGNSSFSWLAALLGDGLVLAPVVDGLEGGKEHDCAFVAGNWPKFAPHLDFVTDLHVSS